MIGWHGYLNCSSGTLCDWLLPLCRYSVYKNLCIFKYFIGRQAIRNTQKGSPFVKALSDEILKLKGNVDIYHLLTQVNRYFLQYRPSNDKYQIPCFLSTLTKKLEIGPKDWYREDFLKKEEKSRVKGTFFRRYWYIWLLFYSMPL